MKVAQTSILEAILVLRLVIVGVILAGIAALLVMVSPSKEDKLVGYFEGVDDSDRTPVLLRYEFEPGRELVFESSEEVITTMDMGRGPEGSVQRVWSKTLLEVRSVSEDGCAEITVTVKEMAMESAGRLGIRRSEYAGGEIFIYDAYGRAEPEDEDIEFRDALREPFEIAVSPVGEVSMPMPAKERDVRFYNLRKGLSHFFFILPREEVAAGSEWEYSVPESALQGAKIKDARSVFLGYREFEGQRCAVLKRNMTIVVGEDAPPEGAPVQRGTVKQANGLVFSLEKGLPLVTFRKSEGMGTASSGEGEVIQASTDEEYIIELKSSSSQ